MEVYRGPWIPLELGLQMVVSHAVGVLELNSGLMEERRSLSQAMSLGPAGFLLFFF